VYWVGASPLSSRSGAVCAGEGVRPNLAPKSCKSLLLLGEACHWGYASGLESVVEVEDRLWRSLVVPLDSVGLPPAEFLYLILRKALFEGVLGGTAAEAVPGNYRSTAARRC
jgi:hypothetical protein